MVDGPLSNRPGSSSPKNARQNQISVGSANSPEKADPRGSSTSSPTFRNE